ncbi:MAG: N-acetylmuramidase family protein [Methylocystis sp.]|uniref:N-acetylmuramidase family protein n=1 Tax=Methylocystis sp. TaxID=1911079 RepID=UPI003DA43CD9
MSVEFSGAARRLTAREVEDAAEKIGCRVAALCAVLAVESRGSGFDAKRRPVILFEPHVFYRVLNRHMRAAGELNGPGSRLDRAVRAGLAYKEWGQRPYPKGSEAQYERLDQASRVDAEAAFQAISIGLGQVLGENHTMAGFNSARAMFDAATESEAAQLDQMVAFIKARRLDDDLRSLNWAGFARGYNGPGQVPKYASWLEREYAKWSKIASKPREELTAKDLRAAGSQTIAATDQAKAGLAVAATSASGALGLADQVQGVVQPIQSAVEHVDSFNQAVAWLQDNWKVVGVIVLALLAAYGAWSIWKGIRAAEEERVRNARDGVNTRF